MNDRPRRAALLTVVLAMSATVACSAGPAPRDHFWRLDIGPPDALEAPPLSGVVEVRRFKADALTGERPIVYRERDEASELHRHVYHYWLDSPTTMLQTGLVTFLRGAKAADVVVADGGGSPRDWTVSGRILRLERVLGAGAESVIVELELGLTRAADRSLALVETYRVERETEGEGTTASVEAFGRATTEIFRRFLGDVSSL
jgi:ABC-type uncharacterized transport system auxiliary subunit